MDIKKVMAVTAAVIGATAMANVVSSSVVGYQQKETVSGFNFFTPTFKQVGSVGDTYNINDIVLDPDTATSWTDNIQILDEGGAGVAAYYWVAAGELLETACWTEDGSSAVNVDFTSGMSFIVETANAVKVTVAGQVLTGNLELTSVAGFNFVGNASPSPIDIQSIKLDADTATSWTDNIQILDEGGAGVAAYYWVAAGELVETACWTEDGSSVAEYTIDPALGFIVETAVDDVTITIPMAL